MVKGQQPVADSRSKAKDLLQIEEKTIRLEDLELQSHLLSHILRAIDQMLHVQLIES